MFAPISVRNLSKTRKTKEEKKGKKRFWFSLGLYTLNKKNLVSRIFSFFLSLVRHKRAKRDKQHVREDVETTRDDDDGGVEARNKRSEDVDDHHEHKHHTRFY